MQLFLLSYLLKLKITKNVLDRDERLIRRPADLETGKNTSSFILSFQVASVTLHDLICAL